MCGGEDGAQKNAQPADGNVSDAKKVVPPAHDSTRGDEDRLGAVVSLRRKDCIVQSQLLLIPEGVPSDNFSQ